MTSPKASGSNPYLDAALSHVYKPYSTQGGTDKIVAFGDRGGMCPTYLKRVPPCVAACPTGQDVRGFNMLLAKAPDDDSAWSTAWHTIIEHNPFPAITGRLCPHPCEGSCNRQDRDSSVGINSIEQAIGDRAIENGLALPQAASETGSRVAVVGSGPASLSAAYQLRRRGHAVTVFERNPQLGGMLRYGIMNYRVDRRVLDAEIQRIVDIGVEVQVNQSIGRDKSLADLEAEFDAVFLGVGAQVGRQLPFDSAQNLPGLTNAASFLRDYGLKGRHDPLGRLLVIGDGDVALDAARLALRLGAEVEVVAAVDKSEMACLKEELAVAEQEGVVVRCLTGTVGVRKRADDSGVDRVDGLVCTTMEKKAKGEEGWNSPVPFLRYKSSSDDSFDLSADTVVTAIGQTPDLTGMEELAQGTPWLKLDSSFKAPGKSRVFGGGDAMKVGLIADAIGHGRRAAESIHSFLLGQQINPTPRQDVIKSRDLDISFFAPAPRKERTHQVPEQVVDNHDEVLCGLDQEAAIEESARCMSCGQCFACMRCLSFCPQEAITADRRKPVGKVMYTAYPRCIGCQICSQLCPSGYIQMGMGDEG